MDETGISVNCVSLVGQFAKLEVMGSKAIQILQKILHPVPRLCRTSKAYFQLMKCSVVEASSDTQLHKSFILEHAAHLPSHAILSLMVKDPRDLPKREIESVSEVPSTSLEVDVLKDESNEHSVLAVCSNKKNENISMLWLNPEVNSVLFSDNKDLWDRNVVIRSVEENLLCMEKHQRWSITLPLNWIKAFWIPLVSCGAHAIGLREKHWIACDVGLPSFPFDFPDSKAYSCFMATEAAASDQRAELLPPSMRPIRVPITPPWDNVRFAFEGASTSMGVIQSLDEKISSREMDPANSLGDASTENCGSASLEQDGSSFEGLITRTSSILSSYMNEIHGGHLLLFSYPLMRERAKFLKNERKLSPSPKGSNRIPVERKLCFLRVLLRAYKEGVFGEGAIVCAPCHTDISLWTSRTEEQEGLKIPQSSIGSYYMQQTSGKWELQKPEDPLARESHRWPVGFVTTGFVQGSTKPQAEALCEATLLTWLRREQWDGVQAKQRRQEVFVLVRNIRSAAYRLALATIVLEQQDEIWISLSFDYFTVIIGHYFYESC